MKKEEDGKTKRQEPHAESDFTKTEYHTFGTRIQYTMLRCRIHISLRG